MVMVMAMTAVGNGGCANNDGEPTAATTGLTAGRAPSAHFQDCNVTMCGTNSPVIAEFGFWDLNIPTEAGTWGLPNAGGIQLYGFYQNNLLFMPRVLNGVLTAHRRGISPPGPTVLTGQQLVGGYFLLRNGARMFALYVDDVSEVESWAQPATGAQVQLETYQLDWAEVVDGVPGERVTNVCSSTVPDKVLSDALRMIGPLASHALLFEGDRIDDNARVDQAIDNTWFNLGCAGSGLAKLALTGHTQASMNAGTFTTTLDERTTALKMFAADYCGNGTAFTVSGQPLNWTDDRGTMQLISAPSDLELEARWGPHGAICLNQPRVAVNPTPTAAYAFPDILAEIQAICPLPPPCDDLSLQTDGAHLMSATPLN
jgi:hypothetical protein